MSSANLKVIFAAWDVSSVEDMRQMFAYSCFNGELKRWRPNKLKELSDMFEGSSYRGDTDLFEEGEPPVLMWIRLTVIIITTKLIK